MSDPCCQCEDAPKRIYRLDLATGRKELWKDLAPYESSAHFSTILPSADGKAYADNHVPALGDLYLVDGLK